MWLLLKPWITRITSSIKIALESFSASKYLKWTPTSQLNTQFYFKQVVDFAEAHVVQLYPYFRLQHAGSIRVLILHPGERLAPIHISLREVHFKDAPQYEALSYTWATEDGDASLSQNVYCNGFTI